MRASFQDFEMKWSFWDEMVWSEIKMDGEEKSGGKKYEADQNMRVMKMIWFSEEDSIHDGMTVKPMKQHGARLNLAQHTNAHTHTNYWGI